jgi:hypothetical protein
MSIPFHAHGWPDILPVQYFHQVFTLPAPVADIAYQNKTVIYDLLFKASALPIMRPALVRDQHLRDRTGLARN